MKNIFILIIAIVFFTSCRSSRSIQSPVVFYDSTIKAIEITDTITEDTTSIFEDINAQLQKNKVTVSTFSAKIDVKYKDGEGKKNNATAHIRMQSDSVIWVSVTGLLGIEGIRGLITKDSVRLIDKQNKVYTARSIAYLQDIVKLPLDMVSLQDLILGNPVLRSSSILSLNIADEKLSLLSIGDFFKNILTLRADNKTIISSEIEETNKEEGRKSFLGYSEYENKKGINFSTSRYITVKEKNEIEIELEFKQYNFNETLSFPFTVPKNYKNN